MGWSPIIEAINPWSYKFFPAQRRDYISRLGRKRQSCLNSQRRLTRLLRTIIIMCDYNYTVISRNRTTAMSINTKFTRTKFSICCNNFCYSTSIENEKSIIVMRHVVLVVRYNKSEANKIKVKCTSIR